MSQNIVIKSKDLSIMHNLHNRRSEHMMISVFNVWETTTKGEKWFSLFFLVSNKKRLNNQHDIPDTLLHTDS